MGRSLYSPGRCGAQSDELAHCKAAHLIRGLLHALEAFGGVPLVTVWDNPKTVVRAHSGDLIVWNPVFGAVALG